jgi:hypothetical protein
MSKEELEKKLIVGAKIRFGKEYAEFSNSKEGEIITLVEGEFENYNGLYPTTENCPAIWCERQNDFDSIYHLFGNDMENFLDCVILP